MDGSEIAVLSILGCVAMGVIVSLLVGGPAYRRQVSRIALTAFYMRCWPIMRDPFRALREHKESLEHRAQQVGNRISAATRRLRRRGCLSEVDARRYSQIAAAAVERVWNLEEDARELRQSVRTCEAAERIVAAARQTVENLGRLHAGLARLLVAAITEGSQSYAEELRGAEEELEATVVALRELGNRGGGVIRHSPSSIEHERPDAAAERQVEIEA